MPGDSSSTIEGGYLVFTEESFILICRDSNFQPPGVLPYGRWTGVGRKTGGVLGHGDQRGALD